MVDFVLDDLLTELETESTTYTFAYGGFALRSSIKIGSRTLAEYDYTNNRNNYLSAIDYGNGDKVQYTYDKQGRLVTQTYEDGDTVTYKYDNNGALATVIDSATGVSTKYYYDFMERLMKYAESGTDYSHSVAYTYDLMNNLTGVVETINGTEFTSTYGYNTGELGSPTSVVQYSYGDSDWGDLVTQIGSNAITYDEIGNMLTFGARSFTWEHGRQLASQTINGSTWTYTYNVDGMRTKRTNQETVYTYEYNGSRLSYMTYGSITMRFTYGADGTPLSIVYNGTTYYYATNLQGDVVAILNSAGNLVVNTTMMGGAACLALLDPWPPASASVTLFAIGAMYTIVKPACITSRAATTTPPGVDLLMLITGCLLKMGLQAVICLCIVSTLL